MINIKVVCVGKLSDKNLIGLSNEYLKRLQKYSKVEVIEIEEQKLNSLENEKIINIESEKIIEKLDKFSKSSKIICLDLKGKALSSTAFAEKISTAATYGASNLVFVIGGSLGFNDDVRKKADYLISFSTLTFPHQLIRIFLFEQLFRAFKILNNETYHH